MRDHPLFQRNLKSGEDGLESHCQTIDDVPIQDRRTPISGRVKVTGYLIMGILCVGMFEILSYSYLRIIEGYDGTHLMNYQFDDYKNIQLTPEYRNTKGVIHNAQGFRRDENTSREKANGTYRIFVMGGSTAYGLGALTKTGRQKYPVIKNDETIDHYLEGFLKDRISQKRVEVINAAITSHFSHHHLIYLNQTVLKYHPDMVIFIDGFNDYYPSSKDFDQFRDYPYRKWSHLYLDEPTMKAWTAYTGWWLFRKSHFVHLVGKMLHPIWLDIQQIGAQQNRIDVDEALSNLSVNADLNFGKMIERNALILRHEGVVPVFTLQPEIEFRQKKTFTEIERNIMQELADHWQENFVEFKNQARTIVHDKMVQATQKTGAFFFDLTDIFGDLEGDIYTDHCHLTPIGNKRVAEYLGERVLSIILGKSKLQAA
jgi:hypothetical protein